MKVLLIDDSVALQQSFGALLQAIAGVAITGYAEDAARLGKLPLHSRTLPTDRKRCGESQLPLWREARCLRGMTGCGHQ